MKLAATFAAFALAAAALTGCDTTEETSSVSTGVAPGAVAGEHDACGTAACCGTCDGAKADVAPGAMGTSDCGSACGAAKSCGAADVNIGAVKDADCSKPCSEAKSCGAMDVNIGAVKDADCSTPCGEAKSCGDAPVAIGAIAEKAAGCCPGK